MCSALKDRACAQAMPSSSIHTPSSILSEMNILPFFSLSVDDSSFMRGEDTKLNKCPNRKDEKFNEKDTRRIVTNAKNLNLTCYQVGNLFYENLWFTSYRNARIFSLYLRFFFFFFVCFRAFCCTSTSSLSSLSLLPIIPSSIFDFTAVNKKMNVFSIYRI